MARGATATAGTKEDTAASAATAARAAAPAATTATTVTVTEEVETWVMEAGTTGGGGNRSGPESDTDRHYRSGDGSGGGYHGGDGRGGGGRGGRGWKAARGFNPY
jgi:hypothetical protein